MSSNIPGGAICALVCAHFWLVLVIGGWFGWIVSSALVQPGVV